MILLMQALLFTDLTTSIHNIFYSGFWNFFFHGEFSFENIVALSYSSIIGYQVPYTIL